MINYKDPVVVIAGPTASGKSSLALKLAKNINGYIINADSRQVYKELKIGTAQPNPDYIEDDTWYIDDVRHYLYGHVSARKKYNLFQYQKDVQTVLNKEDGIPILVGGTGLYIDSVVHNYNLKKGVERETDYSRKDLEKMSVSKLQSLLNKDVLNKLNDSDIKNPIRLIRAIERGDINREKGRRLNHIYMLVDLNTDTLKDRIESRINQMIEEGLVEEVKGLIKDDLNFDIYSMQSIGYQEFNGYLKGEKSLEQVRDEIVLHTIQYSKRQQTWFKRNKDGIKVKGYSQVYDEALKFLSTS